MIDFQGFVTLGNILADWGQFIGALGVMVSLFYVAREIRQNTRAIKAASYQSITEHVTEITYALSANDNLAAFVQRIGLCENPPDDPVDALRWEAYAYSVFRNMDNIHFQYKLGTLDKARMEELTAMALVFNFRWYPQMRNYWTRTRLGFNPDFREYVDRARASAVE